MDLEDDDERETAEAGETVDEVDPVDEADPVDTDPDADPDEDEAEGEPGEGDDGEGEPEETEDPLLSALPEKVQRKIEKRIGKVVKQREAAKAAQAEAERKAQAAEDKLKNANFSDPETGLPFPSELVAADEVKVLKEHQELKDWKRFLKPKRHEGYTDGGGREFTAAQVEARLDEIDDRLEAIGTRAMTIRQRAEAEFAEVLALGREALKQKRAGKGGKPTVTKPGAGKDGKPLSRLDTLLKRKPAAPGRSAGAGGAPRRAGGGGGSGRFDGEAVRSGRSSYQDILDKVIG
jgi:hypothetical protein